ncbi:hypothetical protein B0H17DRAFT_1144821 [Mycena rosella]|uniref:Uncharacterized protein n=1 Tax=Mycena rosella TaxID=1033263 RepID=A0AAD7CSS1_MYCRO|nr:hypothetical protein B0H17DRAFT_1144821 [Mycena rosella]
MSSRGYGRQRPKRSRARGIPGVHVLSHGSKRASSRRFILGSSAHKNVASSGNRAAYMVCGRRRYRDRGYTFERLAYRRLGKKWSGPRRSKIRNAPGGVDKGEKSEIPHYRRARFESVAIEPRTKEREGLQHLRHPPCSHIFNEQLQIVGILILVPRRDPRRQALSAENQNWERVEILTEATRRLSGATSENEVCSIVPRPFSAGRGLSADTLEVAQPSAYENNARTHGQKISQTNAFLCTLQRSAPRILLKLREGGHAVLNSLRPAFGAHPLKSWDFFDRMLRNRATDLQKQTFLTAVKIDTISGLLANS